jgi:long-chain acyl-CoA synthetase
MVYARFNGDDIWLHIAPMFHLADAWACYSVSLAGGQHVFAPGFSPEAALKAIAQYRVTKTVLVPTMINLLTAFPNASDYDTTSLQRVIFGAAPMPVDRLLAATRMFGQVFTQAYGMTETSALLTGMQPEWSTHDGSEPDSRRLSSCGRQLAGVQLRITDPETNQAVLPGTVGEVTAHGANMMIGYWKREQETAKALRDGWLHTGDLAVMDDKGYVFIVDRAKDMIISGGENIYSVEVESALYEHPHILEAAVIGTPDDLWGEVVTAFIVPREGMVLREEDILTHCRARIAAYKCPKKFVFRADLLPKSGPGKVLKSELRKPFWEGRERNV